MHFLLLVVILGVRWTGWCMFSCRKEGQGALGLWGFPWPTGGGQGFISHGTFHSIALVFYSELISHHSLPSLCPEAIWTSYISPNILSHLVSPRLCSGHLLSLWCLFPFSIRQLQFTPEDSRQKLLHHRTFPPHFSFSPVNNIFICTRKFSAFMFISPNHSVLRLLGCEIATSCRARPASWSSLCPQLPHKTSN